MRYAAIITVEGDATLAEFPDCPGRQTFAGAGEDVRAMAQEAFEAWLEATLANGTLPPIASSGVHAPKGGKVAWFKAPSRLAVKLLFRRARQDAGITQGELAARAGVSQQQIAKVEHPDSNPTLATLEKVAKALGVRIEVSLVSDAA